MIVNGIIYTNFIQFDCPAQANARNCASVLGGMFITERCGKHWDIIKKAEISW